VILLALLLVINVVWLLFLSDQVSKVAFKAELPLARAAKCVVFATAISWAIAIALAAVLDAGDFLFRSDPISIATWIAAPVITFLWEWRSFQRHWSEDEDFEEIFE
jgi:hypothetical protein